MAQASVDLSEFYKLSRPKRPPCRVGFILGELAPDERAKLAAALATDKGIINTGAIREWLKLRKQEVSVPALTTHRQQTCTCYDDDE